MRTLRLFGGMLTQPLSTLRSIAHEGAPAWPPIVAYVVITALIELKVLVRLTFLLDEGGATIARRIREAIVDPADTDAVLLLAVAVTLGVLARVLAARAALAGVTPSRAAVAGVWLLVPLLALKCVGGALQAAGVDLWFLPHEAVDSMAIVVNKQVSWLRFAVKCVVAYGPSLAMGVFLVTSWLRAAGQPSPAPLAGVRTRLGLALFTLAFVGLTASAGVSAVRASDRIRPLQAGDALPEVALRRLDEKGVSKKDKVKLPAAYSGKVLVLDFWASWCTPCKRSMPELSRLQDELGPKGLVVLGVNREPADPKDAAEAWTQIRPTFEGVMDDRFYGDRIGLTTLPTSYVVDKKGVVRHLHLGYTEIDIVRAEVEALLNE